MNNHGNFKKTSKDRVENDKKKGRFRNLKNLLKGLQHFLSFLAFLPMQLEILFYLLNHYYRIN